MSNVDVRSPETAYATKDNVVFPGSSAQRVAAQARAAARMADKTTPNIPTGTSTSTATNTVTVVIR